ncbi:MAG: lactate utilization protein C [Rubripirellula sp.]
MHESITATTKNRQGILDRLRTKKVSAPELPEFDSSQMTCFDDPIAKFIEMLEFVGGQAHFVNQPAEIAETLAKIPAFAEATRIASLVPEAVKGNVDTELVDDPHGLASLDWVIAKGEFLVAENGAIWVNGETLPHRVMLFIPQYLALVVSRSQVVHHLHQAYEKIGNPTGFGVFVSGPSKTADIEQSLVLGAHGCRTLQVFLLP